MTALQVVGIVLTVAGGIVATWRRLIGRAYTMGELSGTAGRTEALAGLLLIFAGAVLEMIAAAS